MPAKIGHRSADEVRWPVVVHRDFDQPSRCLTVRSHGEGLKHERALRLAKVDIVSLSSLAGVFGQPRWLHADLASNEAQHFARNGLTRYPGAAGKTQTAQVQREAEAVCGSPPLPDQGVVLVTQNVVSSQRILRSSPFREPFPLGRGK
jgi:hypothetical protein